MKQLQLQPRLQLLAELIPQGSRLADVGTDHGYVPVYLMQRGLIDTAIASDIGAEPLQHAVNTAQEYAIEGIDFRLCPGLDAIAPEECDTVLIAGMGGETIITILENAPWTKAGGHLLILQPMTKVEMLRKWIADNGYTFIGERLVFDKDHLYPIMLVRGGAQPALSEAAQYGGVMLDGDPLYADYLDERIKKLTIAIDGLLRAKREEQRTAAEELRQIRDALEERRRTL
ncbi:MAG: SAM-dependent methyltransferase [Oscillospiraceae bacterium]|nr:SAM-dependent methyltransferase [Oscillospiraceae bacterium]